MNGSETSYEAPSLEEALQKASEALGVPASDIDHRLDRDHFLNGAATVRIFASKKNPENIELKATVEGFLREEFAQREVEADARVKVDNADVRVTLEAMPGTLPEDDEAIETLAQVIKDVAGEALGERTVSIQMVPKSDPSMDRPRRDRGDRDRDRGRGRGRDRDDRGGRGRDRDRDRGRGRGRDRDDRGGRGRDRDRDRDRPKPERDPEREAELRRQAQEAIEQVLEDGHPVTIEGLNSYERRIIHRAVADTEGLTTRSVGRGSLKAVRVLEGDDEDDED